jgi:hypothetical protein
MLYALVAHAVSLPWQYSADLSVSFNQCEAMLFDLKGSCKIALLTIALQIMSFKALRQSAASAFRLHRRAISNASPQSAVRPVTMTASPLTQKKSYGRNRLFKLGALAAFASTSAVAASAGITPVPVETFRSDYKPSDFYVSDIYLSFKLDTDESIVTTKSQMTRSISPASKDADLVLDGEDLDLIHVRVSGKTIAPELYKYADGKLRIPSSVLPDSAFELETAVRLRPDQNLALSGLYKSGNY